MTGERAGRSPRDDPEDTPMQERPIPTSARYPFAFTGSGGEYFRIWIVNVLLSIVTLYVYSAWAKVRTRRYFHGNTVLDGSAFEYHARGLQILGGRVLAVLLLAAVTFGGAVTPLVPIVATAVLFAVLPWALWRSTQFNARMTSYRNVRFGFRGSVGRMYLYVLVLPFLPLIVALAAGAVLALASDAPESVLGGLLALGVVGFYAIAPWVHKRLAEYLAGHHRYGRAGFETRLSTGRFYAIYLLSFLVAVAILLVLALALGALLWLGGAASPEALGSLAREEEGGNGAASAVLVLALYPPLFLAGYLVSAFFRARIRNHVHGGTVVDGRVRLESTVRTWPLWRLTVGNLLLLVLTLGIAYPWTRVRLARFLADHTAVLAPGGLHAVVDDEQARQSALGEELGDAFDMDMDIGF